jgi:hypothetical protein
MPETRVRDYSNRSCATCNLHNTNNGGEKSCELKLEAKCASFANDESLGDYWISCLDDESDSILYVEPKFTLELTKAEALGLMSCLVRTSAKGTDLDVGEMIEDKLAEFLNIL